MSPETIYYNNYSEKSDIWALGVVLYEMIFGKMNLHQLKFYWIGFPPFKASSESKLLNMYLT